MDVFSAEGAPKASRWGGNKQQGHTRNGGSKRGSSKAQRFLRGKCRSDVRAEEKPSRLDSRTAKVVPGPPIELDATKDIAVSSNRGISGSVAT